MSPEDFLSEYECALATQKWSQIEHLIHKSCAFVFSEGTFIGKEAAGQAFETTFAEIRDEQYKLSDIQWIYVSDSFATCVYTFSWKGLIDGQLRSGGGRGTSVLVCEDNRWYLVNEHLGPLAH